VSIGGNFVSTGVIAPLSQLQSVSYSWYRDSDSTVAKHLHPVLRILLDADGDLTTVGDRGGLVWESVYQLYPYTAPTNTWVTQTITDSSWLWNFGLGGNLQDIDGDGYAHNSNLAAWKAYFPNAVIIGFNMGLGSGWTGDFIGAVDNISWTINGITTTTNFEVVPEPTTMALFGFGTAGRGGRSAAPQVRLTDWSPMHWLRAGRLRPARFLLRSPAATGAAFASTGAAK
jgi:hypothetical protein